MRTLNWVTLWGAGLLVGGCRDAAAPEPESIRSDAIAPVSDNANLTLLSNVWATRQAMLYGRTRMPAAALNGIIYGVGGEVRNSNDDLVATTTLQTYNVGTNTWSTRRSLPTAKFGRNGASVINGRIYVTGGYIDKTVFAYDPATNTWTQKRDMPGVGGYGAQGVINGRLYVLTGSKFYRYNPATNLWVARATPPLWWSHSSPASGVIGGKFYVAGGQDVFEGFPTTDVEAYDPATNTWQHKAPIPGPLYSAASAVINGKLYVAGGIGSKGTEVRGLRVYDPATDQWTTKLQMPTARNDAAGSAASGKFFVLGGSNASSYNLRTVEAYTP